MRRATESFGPLLFLLAAGLVGYLAGKRDLSDAIPVSYRNGYEAGMARAAREWPLQGSVYRSEKDRREAERQRRDETSRKDRSGR